MGRRLNLEEIGRLAGVSRSTVSRVVNGAPNVSDQAKARVEEVVEQTGYRPHAAARSLAANRTNVDETLRGSSTVPVTEGLDASCDDHEGAPQIEPPGEPVACASCGAPRNVQA